MEVVLICPCGANLTNYLLLEPEGSMAETRKILVNVYSSLLLFLQDTGTLSNWNLDFAIARMPEMQGGAGDGV